jgi:sugar lactone lactonase YvrE
MQYFGIYNEEFMTENLEQSTDQPSSFTRLRALMFLVGTVIVGVLVIVLITWWVVGSAPRATAIAIDETITVSEYIILPDDDSYPASLAIADDGTLYTGSYKTGVVWSITSDGVITELADTRDRIGAVSGLDIAPDGTLIILDRIDALDALGAIIWRYADGELSSLAEVPYADGRGVVLPDDITVDGAGFIYITDRDPARVLRYTPDGLNQEVWWTPVTASDGTSDAPTGLAYDAVHDVILITGSNQDAIYRVSATSSDLNEALNKTELLYVDTQANSYSFDGITVTASGGIYVALLNWNRVARLDGNDLVMLARDFRGASDVAYDADKDALIVTNWNQFSLGFGTSPQLPFALDILDLSPEAITE